MKLLINVPNYSWYRPPELNPEIKQGKKVNTVVTFLSYFACVFFWGGGGEEGGGDYSGIGLPRIDGTCVR